MDSPILFSSRVLKDLRALPVEMRAEVANAFANVILGCEDSNDLSGVSRVAYIILSGAVRHDSTRYMQQIDA